MSILHILFQNEKYFHKPEMQYYFLQILCLLNHTFVSHLNYLGGISSKITLFFIGIKFQPQKMHKQSFSYCKRQVKAHQLQKFAYT